MKLLQELMMVNEDGEMKSVTVNPTPNQLSKGAKALDACKELSDALMSKLSAKEKRIIANAVYRAMVGNPQR